MGKSIDNRDVYFITGATGLMGSEFLYEVISQSKNAECILLIRAEDSKNLEYRLDTLITYLFADEGMTDEAKQRITAVIGEIGLDKLGMSDSDWEMVSTKTNYILHAAALTDWGAPLEDAIRVNVEGVTEIIKLAHECGTNLKKLLHISTAYTSGYKTGKILPNEIGRVENACDNYQRSKIEGEAIVRNAFSTLPITIVKPGAVVGNSVKGRTINYQTFYYPLKLMYFGLNLLLPVSSKGNLEAVPSDWTAKVMLEMIWDETSNSQCYHLTCGSEVLTNADIKRIVFKSFRSVGEEPSFSFYIPLFVYKLLVSKILVYFFPGGDSIDEKVRLYRHYMTYVREYDNSETLALIENKNITLPVFEEYLPNLMRYAIKHKWEKRRKMMRENRQSKKAK